MDGCGNTSRMDTADNAITLHKGRASGLFYTPRLIPNAVGHSGNFVQKKVPLWDKNSCHSPKMGLS